MSKTDEIREELRHTVRGISELNKGLRMLEDASWPTEYWVRNEFNHKDPTFANVIQNEGEHARSNVKQIHRRAIKARQLMDECVALMRKVEDY